MANTNLKTIIRRGKKNSIPDRTEIKLSVGSLPATATIQIRFPGVQEFTTLPDLPIRNEVLELPLPIVFLCHASEDKSAVRSLDNRLRSEGILTWFDERELLPGDDWERRIADAIDEADYVLVCISKVSVSKEGFCQREVRFALERQGSMPFGKRFTIPVRLDDGPVPRELSKFHWVDVENSQQFSKLVKSLREY